LAFADCGKVSVTDIIIGIDPGAVSGAYSVLTRDGKFCLCNDFPVKDKMIDGKQLADDLDNIIKATGEASAILEHVNAMPGQGVCSSFNFGQGFGIIKGVLDAFEVPYDLVRPAKWKKALHLDREAETSLCLARELYPASQPFLKRKKDHNRAEAILLAHYWLVSKTYD
jgi:crossover junction endodeoxyribonuclease RuvC